MIEETTMGKVPVKTQEQKDKELSRLIDWVKQLLPNDWDKYDVRAKYDSTLSYVENKNLIRDEIKPLIKEDLKTQKEAMESAQEKMNDDLVKAAEKEAEEWNKKLTYEDTSNLDVFYKPIHRAVNKICQGYSNLAFIKGRGGIGKSHNIRKMLIKAQAEYYEVSGEVTEAYLYRLIFEHNGQIIWFKDVVKLLTALGSMNLLKAATETEDARMLTKNNYSKSQDDLPDKFICRAKFIFDYNSLLGAPQREDFEALVSRGDYVELAICDEEIMQIMRTIAKTDTEKLVTEYLIENYKGTGYIRLNLRTQWKAVKTYEYAISNNLDWKQELKSELQSGSKTRAILYSLIGNKSVRTSELKKLLLKYEFVNTLRTADNRINDWIAMDEIFTWSSEEANFLVAINPKPQQQELKVMNK